MHRANTCALCMQCERTTIEFSLEYSRVVRHDLAGLASASREASATRHSLRRTLGLPNLEQAADARSLGYVCHNTHVLVRGLVVTSPLDVV